MNDRVRTPQEQVTGAAEDPDRAQAAVESLVAAGFDPDVITVGGGEQGMESLDPDGSRHGWRGRVRRTLEQFGQEGEEHRVAAEELREGHLLLLVRVADEGQKDLAVATLRGVGVGRLRYWGQWGVEEISA